MQTYNDDANDVYIGAGRVELESPDTTDIFHGRVLKAVADTRERTVTLHCEDWLNQLKDEKIKYDMREDLDGSGLREYYVAADYTDNDGLGIYCANKPGAAFAFIYFYGMAWAVDQFNDMYLVFTTGMAGDTKVKTGPYTHTANHSDGAMDVDLFVGVNPDAIEDLWVENEDYYSVSDAAVGD
jgi:hypothetical protein